MKLANLETDIVKESEEVARKLATRYKKGKLTCEQYVIKMAVVWTSAYTEIRQSQKPE